MKISTASTEEKFSYLATFKSLLLVLVAEGVFVWTWNLHMFEEFESFRAAMILSMAFVGTFTIIILSTEVVREIRDALNMYILLMATILQFIVFFAFQYWYLSLIAPLSYPGLILSPISLIYQSTMIFVFNPLMSPSGNAAELLVLINILGAIAIVVFVLQNLWQIRRGDD